MTTLVVTDLDGTLWDNSLQCHPDTLAAMSELLARQDVEVLVATGRRRNSARRGLAGNDLVLPAVLLNGAIGFDFAANSVFHQVTFRPESLARAAAVLRAHALAPVAYLTDTRVLAVEGVTTGMAHVESLGDDLEWTTFDQLVVRDDVLGMSMLGIELAQITPAVDPLSELSDVEAAALADHQFPPYSLMLAPDGVTKELGISAYLNHTGLEPERIIALGDGGNDLEMLAMADTALSVVGGDQRAIDLADHVIGRPENGGWAAVLDYL